MDARIGSNINGPSLIRAPDWLPGKLGTYYLYFAHHEGSFIRLAVADSLAGPWRIYPPGVLSLCDSHFFDHIASPDVHVDSASRTIRMYFHGVTGHSGATQGTRVALSADGLSFEVLPELLAPMPYLRAFPWEDAIYAITMPGAFWRSPDGLTPFVHVAGPPPSEAFVRDDLAADEWPLPLRSRHLAVSVMDDLLLVVYSRGGDCPERLLYSALPLHDDWTRWTPSEPNELLAPETAWEGGHLPCRPSAFGAVHHPARQLRDPALFVDGDRRYLVYSIAGERGLALAEVIVQR